MLSENLVLFAQAHSVAGVQMKVIVLVTRCSPAEGCSEQNTRQ
nr:hypothetical protein [Desulfitobacterium hafniense]